MVSFWKLLESMNDVLLDSGESSKAERVVRTGIGLRSNKDCGNFWDDFISVCNDSEGLSELLNVPPEKISNWSAKVQEMLEKVEDSDGGTSKRDKVVSTGDDTLADPDGVDASPNEPADTRPMP